MKFLKEIPLALIALALLLSMGVGAVVYGHLYNGATPESRTRLALQKLGEEEISFMEERTLLDGSAILWVYEQDGQRGYVRFMADQDGYYYAGDRLGESDNIRIDSAWNEEESCYIVLLDRDDLAYLEYEIYADDLLWKAEKIEADWLMTVEMPQSDNSKASFVYYDVNGNRYEK